MMLYVETIVYTKMMWCPNHSFLVCTCQIVSLFETGPRRLKRIQPSALPLMASVERSDSY